MKIGNKYANLDGNFISPLKYLKIKKPAEKIRRTNDANILEI